MIRRRLPDILMIALLFALPLVMFWQQTVGGYTLLPTENLYQFEPFATYREVAKAPALPHNALVSDLVLQNYQWKSFIRESLLEGEIPLWNPYQFSGIPFLAAGQQSTLYPFSILYYVLPLTAAYGWFTVVQLWLAGVFMYLFARGLNVGRFGAIISAITYQLSAFFVISAVFPMIIGAAAWLPLLLLMIEFTIQQRPAWRGRPASVPWVAIGAVALGCNILAGHVEITYYTLLIMGYYAAARLVWELWKSRREMRAHSRAPLRVISRGVWLVIMVALGIGLGAVQFVPLFELAGKNFRAGSASYEQVIDWAHKSRDIVQFILPNFYGNPTHHSYVDVFTWQNIPATTNALGQPINTIDWGIKNYVEGALYLGILPLLLAAYTLLNAWVFRRRDDTTNIAPYRVIFMVLGLFGLTFMFGLPTYRLLYFLPGIDQLHSPFRWIFAVTLGVAVLAGFGADALTKIHQPNDVEAQRAAPLQNAPKWVKRIGLSLMFIGVLILIGTRISVFVYPQLESIIDRLLHALAKAPEAFADARMFYSYQYTNIMTLGFFMLGAGLVFWLAGRVHSVGAHGTSPRDYGWQILSIGLIALDLIVASWGFNPASEPALLDFRPPAIEWLQGQPGTWRYTTLDDPNQRPIMNANMGWRYDLYDIRGYESIIPKQYVDYMEQVAPQVQLEYNRVAPFYTPDDYNHFGGYHRTLDSPLLDLLNVRYIFTHKNTSINFQEWKLAYEDEAVRIWENDSMVPRVYLLPEDDETLFADSATLAVPRKPIRVPEHFEPATITQDTGREKFVDVSITEPAWLVVSESYFPGWKAYIQRQDTDNDQETALEVQLVQGNFQGIHITTPGDWTVRLVYSPTSFQVGGFTSFISVVLILFMFGVWAWRLMVAPQEQEASAISRVARNSLAPIILNLFNRGLDFAFAAVMFRILDPTDAGLYQYAIVIFVWFDILTNFGLNTFLTREVSQDRSRAGHYFFNTSIMRLVLIVIGVLPLVAFISARQAFVSPSLNPEGLLALGLLYFGLLPNSLSTGMTAVFYAFEKAEYPSVVSTIATVNKVVCGVAVLVLGYGIIGLAAVSIFTNFITLAILLSGGRELLRRGDSANRPYNLDWPLIGNMTRESWPLMLNHFLATIFFQIDVVLIEAIHGGKMVAQYSVAYKWIAAINVIPAFFTMAMLPVMSRQARDDLPTLKRTYTLAVKLLVNIALPTAVVFTFTAYVLTTILGGAEYLPDGAIATQLMIWSIPIGWINSLTQYVLIALNLQRRITWAFIIAVTFNIVANLILIPMYGYRAAALTTIASEVILLIPFGILLARAAGPINWFEMIWRSIVATGVMFGVMLISWNAQPVLALLFGVLVYPTVLLMLHPFSRDETERLLPLLPARFRRIWLR